MLKITHFVYPHALGDLSSAQSKGAIITAIGVSNPLLVFINQNFD
ncbi:MAG: hypothetical protein UY74_C0020G0007 [Candidatus Kaiserbacteria bacterium GW2011_GWC2_52_8b]|uniref:Uncharacterized protein n=2 Tax=Candidatus Kaiseribacteriota TaxID=1752734 RepID=A0A0G1XK34_9BACT|nr:MAG: hypothetical protein UY67_C0024G0006 [Candidatus Kaiserbacteria bacterium GW2011_GWA2_52_12]KKW31230.1 MAG: hypothetical protein UY74_C0020G0007 [Candidatus Kaiserbacteria bacterium GW2011_GWC2_52_8b]